MPHSLLKSNRPTNHLLRPRRGVGSIPETPSGLRSSFINPPCPLEQSRGKKVGVSGKGRRGSPSTTERRPRGSGLETAPVFSQRGKRARFVVRSSLPPVEKPCPLSPHTGFSCHYPEPWEKRKKMGASLLVCGAKQRGFQGGWPSWSQDAVQEGGQGAERPLEGESEAFSPKKPMGKRAD